MKERFDHLKDEFARFVGTFGTWATEKEKENDNNITRLYGEIADLQKELEKLDIALKTLLATLAVTLPATGILSIIFAPIAPIIMVS
jgi:hypothetical protein